MKCKLKLLKMKVNEKVKKKEIQGLLLSDYRDLKEMDKDIDNILKVLQNENK